MPLDSVDSYSDIATSITNYFTQQQAQFVTGVQDIDDDATWNAYVEGIKNLGLESWLSMQGVSTIA